MQTGHSNTKQESPGNLNPEDHQILLLTQKSRKTTPITIATGAHLRINAWKISYVSFLKADIVVECIVSVLSIL